MTAGKHNEHKAWLNLSKSQKSYTVSVLHFFHFRPNRVRASWRQEEVLTWELYLALRVLPRRLFLKPILDSIGKLSGSATTTAKTLSRDLPNLSLEYSPSLRLGGSLRNSCSDIGIVGPNNAALWIEAKTMAIHKSELDRQLRTQKAALAKIYGSKNSQVVALIPSRQEISLWPSLRWATIVAILKQCRMSLEKEDSAMGLTDGLIFIATELQDRISEHELKIIH